MKLKTYLALILCLAVSATTLAGCGKQPGNTSNGGGGGTQGGSTKDTVVIVTSGDPGRLRSDTLNSLKEIPFNRLAYDYLFTRNSNWHSVQPLPSTNCDQSQE